MIIRKGWKIVSVSVLAAAGIVYLSLSASDATPFQAISNVNEAKSAVVPEKISEREPSSEKTNQEANAQSEADSVTSLSQNSTKVLLAPKPEQLKTFKTIQAKVFRNKEDEKKWKRLLSDSKYILELSEYLKNIPKIEPQDFKDSQNAVIDFLVEALKSGDSVAAESAILEVIKDSQVEDEKIAQPARELLAGVKADLLYQSSSVKPQLVSQIENALPGPVSQKIWKNVQQQQADNLALSEAELNQRLANRNQ